MLLQRVKKWHRVTVTCWCTRSCRLQRHWHEIHSTIMVGKIGRSHYRSVTKAREMDWEFDSLRDPYDTSTSSSAKTRADNAATKKRESKKHTGKTSEAKSARLPKRNRTQREKGKSDMEAISTNNPRPLRKQNGSGGGKAQSSTKPQSAVRAKNEMEADQSGGMTTSPEGEKRDRAQQQPSSEKPSALGQSNAPPNQNEELPSEKQVEYRIELAHIYSNAKSFDMNREYNPGGPYKLTGTSHGRKIYYWYTHFDTAGIRSCPWQRLPSLPSLPSVDSVIISVQYARLWPDRHCQCQK